MDVQHIPAWKRLGLKLKFASDNITSTEHDLSFGADDLKKKRSRPAGAVNGSSGENHQLKKARLDREASPDELNIDRQKDQSTPHRASSPKRKKSVSFAPDTKIEDGDSAQTIQFWVPDSPGSTPMKHSPKDNNTLTGELPKKAKREKRLKDAKQQTRSAPPRKASAALTYLDNFHRERTSWKFNKNHETWLLKHALSTENIPPTHNLALASYLKGLKSTAAKQRLAELSREALSSVNVDVTSNVESSTKLQKILGTEQVDTKPISDDSDWLREMPRGQLILVSLDEDFTKSRKPVYMDRQSATRVKKNKSRTSRIEIESSSESDSESQDDRDVHQPKTGSISKVANGTESEDETSSSGSSSTSSDIDSETEEGSDTSSGSE